MTQSSTDIAAQYIEAFWSGDVDAARPLVADGVRFSGPFRDRPLEGKEAYFETGQYLRNYVRGHELLHRWADASEVCSIIKVRIETGQGTGELLLTEWHTVEDGRIVQTRIIFDTAKYHALIPNRPSVIK